MSSLNTMKIGLDGDGIWTSPTTNKVSIQIFNDNISIGLRILFLYD